MRTSSGPGMSPVHEAVLVSPRGREINLPLPTDGEHAGVVRRAGLDAALVSAAPERAASTSAKVSRSTDLAVAADGVKVRIDTGETIEARHLVAADGHWSTVRRHLHPDAPRDLGTWHAVRQYFDGVDDARLWTFFFEDLLPGYAWVFPTARRRRQRRLRRAPREAARPRPQGVVARSAGAARVLRAVLGRASAAR